MELINAIAVAAALVAVTSALLIQAEIEAMRAHLDAAVENERRVRERLAELGEEVVRLRLSPPEDDDSAAREQLDGDIDAGPVEIPRARVVRRMLRW